MLRSILVRYGVAVAAVGFIVIIKTPLESLVGSGPPLILFIPALTFSAWFGGIGPGLLTTALGVLSCNYLYFPPVGSLRVESGYDQVQLSLFVVEGILTSVLMQQLIEAKRQSESSARKAEEYRDTLQQAEEAVRRERDFAESLIVAAQAIVLVLDHQGRVLQSNPFFEHVTGRQPDRLGAPNWFETFVPVQDQTEAREAFESALTRPEGSQVIHRIVARGGRLRHFEWTHRMLPGASRGLLTIGHDITELKEAQQRALQAERLAAIGQMVTGLAHESRNALQRSQACLEMLVLSVGNRPEELDLITGIQEAQDDLHRLYEEVRNYAAPIRLDRRPCCLREVLREAWAHLEPQWKGRRVQLREHGLHEPACEADRFRLQQVFRNILDNALAACADPVEIVVDWSDAEFEGESAVRIVLRDNGPGLTPEQRFNLFEPFYTTKTQGTGLGMAIAKRIVEAHGGGITVDSSDLPGGRIIITLPRGQL
jgi:PAS domain S-box-containing protein